MRSCCCKGITCTFPDGSIGTGKTGTCCYMEPLGNCCVQGYVYSNNPEDTNEYLEKIDCIKELTKSECDSYNILGQQKATWTLYSAPTTCVDPDKAECSETMCGSTYPNEQDPGEDVPGFCRLYKIEDSYIRQFTECASYRPCTATDPVNPSLCCIRSTDQKDIALYYTFDSGSFTDQYVVYDSPPCSSGSDTPRTQTNFVLKLKKTYLGLVPSGSKRFSGTRKRKEIASDCTGSRIVVDTETPGFMMTCQSVIPSNASVPPSSSTSSAASSSTGNYTKTKRHLCDCINDITECDCANKNAESWDAARDPITGYSGKTGGDWIWTESGDCNLTTPPGATGIIGCRGACCVSVAGISTAENPCPDWVGIECIDNTTQCECDNFTEYGSDGQATKFGDFKGLGTTCSGDICLPDCKQRNCNIYEVYQLITEESSLPDCTCSKFNPNCSSTDCTSVLGGSATGTPNCADRIECTDCPTRNPFNCTTVSGFAGGSSYNRVSESYAYYWSCDPPHPPFSETITKIDDRLGPSCTSTYVKTTTVTETLIQKVPPGPFTTSFIDNTHITIDADSYGCKYHDESDNCGSCTPLTGYCNCC